MASPGSKSTLYKKKRKEVKTQKDGAKLFQIFKKEVVQKCFIDQEVLQDHDTFAMKATFYGETKESTIMCLPKSMHALQKQVECIKVFTLTRLDQFF